GRPGDHAARGAANARHRDRAAAADPPYRAPRPEPVRADATGPERGGPRPRTHLEGPGPRQVETGPVARPGGRPHAAGRRPVAPATGRGEPALQRPRRDLRDAKPPPRRRPQERTSRPGRPPAGADRRGWLARPGGAANEARAGRPGAG